jgi:hypothetical protein
MKIPAWRLIKWFIQTDDLSKRNNIVMQNKRARCCEFCSSEVVTTYMWFVKRKTSRSREFYDGIHEQFLQQFVPKMPI